MACMDADAYNIAIMQRFACSAALAMAAVQAVAQAYRPASRPTRTLTAVPGIKVGHHTLAERPTGCTVVLIEAGATAGVDVRGAAPARATPIC